MSLLDPDVIGERQSKTILDITRMGISNGNFYVFPFVKGENRGIFTQFNIRKSDVSISL
jgi:hypothetical protein